MNHMKREEHAKRHVELHAALDELVADYITNSRKTPLLKETSVLELMEWSHAQTLNPTSRLDKMRERL